MIPLHYVRPATFLNSTLATAPLFLRCTPNSPDDKGTRCVTKLAVFGNGTLFETASPKQILRLGLEASTRHAMQ